jgi:NAD(P)-dependent dehydrogenase (short-subunit alcohol dehydrogenase family)
MLENRTAVVTGVGPGMGTDIALQLAEAGADLVLVARSDRVMPEVQGRIEDMGRRCVTVSADICSEADRTALVDTVDREFGRLDILVNSAFHGGRHESFAEANLEKWHRPMDVNFFGTLSVTQALLPALRRAAADTGDARIVMVNTMSVQHLEATHGSYAASKAALGAITKTLALELGADGIRVNAVHPGYIWGDSVRTYFEWQATDRGGETTWEDIYAERAAETALGYLPDSSEIAGAVVFFASPLARCVTGTALPVNAGHWMPPSA